VEALEAWDSTTGLIVAAEYVAILGGYLVVAPVSGSVPVPVCSLKEIST
jgi:hypothetical protein